MFSSDRVNGKEEGDEEGRQHQRATVVAADEAEVRTETTAEQPTDDADDGHEEDAEHRAVLDVEGVREGEEQQRHRHDEDEDLDVGVQPGPLADVYVHLGREEASGCGEHGTREGDVQTLIGVHDAAGLLRDRDERAEDEDDAGDAEDAQALARVQPTPGAA